MKLLSSLHCVLFLCSPLNQLQTPHTARHVEHLGEVVLDAELWHGCSAYTAASSAAATLRLRRAWRGLILKDMVSKQLTYLIVENSEICLLMAKMVLNFVTSQM